MVLSIPAAFDQARRKALLDAAQIAGIDVLGTLNDPVAAVLAFAETEGYLAASVNKPASRLLVFDLGAGTLDAAIIEVKPGHIRTLGLAGNPRLGGRDWALRLAEHLAQEFLNQYGEDPRYDLVSVRRLIEAAEEAKHTLSVRQQTKVPVSRTGQSAELTITRQTFEQITTDLVAQCKTAVEAAVRKPAWSGATCRTCWPSAGPRACPPSAACSKSSPGSNRCRPCMPTKRSRAAARFTPSALLAARERRPPQAPLEISDLTAHSLGVKWLDSQTGRPENVVIIRRGTELPCGSASKVNIASDGERSIVIHLIEGESRNPAECSPFAEVTISDLPTGLTKASNVNVRYRYSTDRQLKVKAQMPDDGPALTVQLRREGSLSESQLAEWKKVFAGPEGLKPILAFLTARPKDAPAAPFAAPADERPWGQTPPPLGTVAGEPDPWNVEDLEEAAQNRPKKRKTTPRQTAIMLAGHVIFAALGLAIGYYILMVINPSYNWLHLRLPGL